ARIDRAVVAEGGPLAEEDIGVLGAELAVGDRKAAFDGDEVGDVDAAGAEELVDRVAGGEVDGEVAAAERDCLMNGRAGAVELEADAGAGLEATRADLCRAGKEAGDAVRGDDN